MNQQNLADFIWNVADKPGFGGWLFHALGMTGDAPRTPGIVKLRAVKDKEALRDQLEDWSRIGDLQRIIPSHGRVVTKNPSGVLHALAESIAA